MSKTTSTEQPDKRDSDASVAIKPKAYTDLIKAVSVANDKMDTGRQNKSELIRDAVEIGLHKTAFSWVMKLRKMDPVKRNELLFHFDVYCEREKFAREDLLADRPEPTARIVRAVPDKNGVPREIDEDGEPDMRPSHMRQPGASAADAVDKIKNDALSQVGRGKPDASKSH